MIEFWLADENIIFAASGCLLFALIILQIIGVGDFGSDVDLDADLDTDIDTDISGPSFIDGLLSVLGLKRLPFMIWLGLFLMLFTISGYLGQQILAAMTGALLPTIIAAPIAATLALFLSSVLAIPLEQVIPKDETTAVSLDTLVGRFATLEIGKAVQGSSARAKVSDIYGHNHYIMVEPDNAGQTFVTGEKLLLVRREGNVFKAISQGEQHLPHL